MILETDEETRDFVTVYKKHYNPKRVRRISKCIHPVNYNSPLNVLNGPFHDHLNSLRKNEKVSPEKRSEDIRDNLERVRAKYPHLHKLLPDITPDEIVVESVQEKALKTIYQLEYSGRHDDCHSLHVKRTGENTNSVILPDDYVIPETIHKTSYRNPHGFANSGEDARKRKIRSSTDNLDSNNMARNILPISTGNSEYVDVIGATGRRIFKEQLNDGSIRLDASSSWVKGPDSMRSECSDVIAASNTTFISHNL